MNPTRALTQHLKTLLSAFDEAKDNDGYAITALRLGKLVGVQDRAEGCLWLKEGMARIQGEGKSHLQAKYLLAVATLRCGDRTHCWAALAEAERLWEGHIPGLVAVARERGLLAADEGDWPTSAHAFAQAKALLPQGAHEMHAELEALEAKSHLHAGDAQRALASLSPPPRSPNSPNERLRAVARWELLTLCHCANLAHRPALECINNALDLIDQGDPLRLGPLMTCTELHLALCAPRRAHNTLAEARTLISDLSPPSLRARWHLCMAQLLSQNQPQQPTQSLAELRLARAFALDDPSLLSQIDSAIEKLSP